MAEPQIPNEFTIAGTDTGSIPATFWIPIGISVPSGSITIALQELIPGSITSVYTKLQEMISGMSSYATCPDCSVPGSIVWLITHLNDLHAWTREEIADWLDNLDIDLTIRPQGVV